MSTRSLVSGNGAAFGPTRGVVAAPSDDDKRLSIHPEGATLTVLPDSTVEHYLTPITKDMIEDGTSRGLIAYTFPQTFSGRGPYTCTIVPAASCALPLLDTPVVPSCL